MYEMKPDATALMAAIEPARDLGAGNDHMPQRGLGDAPSPPNYPKMPGEPPRVQPSKKNEANWPKDELS